MSIKQLAELHGVSTDTVRRAARSGLIPSTRDGIAYRLDLRKVRQAMEEHARSRPTEPLDLARGTIRLAWLL